MSEEPVITRKGLFPPRVLNKSLSVATSQPINETNLMNTAAEWDYKSKAGRSCGTDRVVPGVEPPESMLLSKEMLFSNEGKPNIPLLKTHFLRQGRLDIPAAILLIQKATEVLRKEANCVDIQTPVIVCGDIHGQLFDMISMFELTSKADKYLFLGDYVDRGDFSTEVFFYLCALKIVLPERMFLLRGNHETRMMAEFMTFADECEYKYGSEELYIALMAAFDSLPLCAVVRGCAVGSFFCVHGGISPSLSTIEEINQINRFVEPPTSGPLCDLLWADPVDDIPKYRNFALKELQDWQGIEFTENKKRQTSVAFGCLALQKFLEKNNFICVVRAHEVTDEGFKEHHFLLRSPTPLCVTIFSAPNYCDMYNNRAAVMEITSKTYRYLQFSAQLHPFSLPDFVDPFSYSVPFLMENLVMMLSEMVIDIKEEDPSQFSPEEEAVGRELEIKATKMKEIMFQREKRNIQITKKKQEMLAATHPNMSIFERALHVDAKNEVSPHVHKRPPRERALKKQTSLRW